MFTDSRLVLAAIKGLSVQIGELTGKFDSLITTIQAIALKTGVSSSGSFLMNNDLKLPFNDMASFQDFNKKLEDNVFCEEFVSFEYKHLNTRYTLNFFYYN